jgi:hypothetical protein
MLHDPNRNSCASEEPLTRIVKFSDQPDFERRHHRLLYLNRDHCRWSLANPVPRCENTGGNVGVNGDSGDAERIELTPALISVKLLEAATTGPSGVQVKRAPSTASPAPRPPSRLINRCPRPD